MSFLDDDDVAPLVTCDGDGKYEVHAESLEWLSDQHMPLGVLACAGKYRTGKSYLMNRLCGAQRADSFGVGNTVQACTKGIWIRKKLMEGEHCKYICLDTEGIDALDADNTHDVRIFTLALLLSSLFIYNSTGAIDESSMQTLSLMTKVSHCVRVRDGDEAPSIEGLSDFLPHFVWVLRDFTLQITNREGASVSNDEYLESSLREPEGAPEKHTVRRNITSAFRRRNLMTLPRPCADEHLGDLARRASYLTPAFNERVEELREFVRANIHPMRADRVDMSGAMYAQLCAHLVSGVGASRVPVIRDAWSLMSEVRGREARERALSVFHAGLAAVPPTIARDALEDTLFAIGERALRAFDDELLDAQPTLRTELARQVQQGIESAREVHDEAVVAEIERRLRGLHGQVAAAQHLGSAIDAVRAARESVQDVSDERLVSQWKATAFDRLVDEWLRPLGDAHERVVQVALERAEAAERRAEQATRDLARAGADQATALDEQRRLAGTEVAQLQLETAQLRELLVEERARLEDAQRRCVQLELDLEATRASVARASVVPSVADDDGAADEDGAGAGADDELGVLRGEVHRAHEERRLAEEEIAELRSIRAALFAQVEEMQQREEEQAPSSPQWSTSPRPCARGLRAAMASGARHISSCCITWTMHGA